MSYHIVTLPAYRAIGLKWEGTFSEVVPHLKATIKHIERRAVELEHKVNPNFQLGLSYHIVKDGFVHYCVYEVSEEQHIPEGMIEIRVPELTYVKTTHNKGEEIHNTYTGLYQWLIESDYIAYKEDNTTYFDDIMPIKHEYYPVSRNRSDEHFDIYIPIVNK